MAEVLIVGGSVAGAATAIHLSRLGRSVQLIDRATFPRRKACGEGLFSPGVVELERFGVLPGLLPQAQVLTALRLSFQGRAIEAPMGQANVPVIGVQRTLLDTALLEAATASGVDLRLGVTAMNLIEDGSGFAGVETDKGLLPARVIVAADGARSRLRRQARIDVEGKADRYGISSHFQLPRPPAPRVDVHVRGGYEVYVTPVGGGLVNYALLLGRERAGRLAGRLAGAFCEMIEESGALPEGSVLVDGPLVAGPFPAAARKAWESNLVLAGDAGGFFDGVTGDGMSLALVTARLCAAAVDRFLSENRPAPFVAYERKRRALARNSHTLGRLLLALAAHPRLGERAITNLARNPATFAKLVRINQGEGGFSSLRPRDLVAALVGL